MDRFHVATTVVPLAVVAGLVTWLTGSQLATAVVVFPLVFALINRSVHVVLSPQEVVIRRGPFWLGRRRYPLADITGIDVVPVTGFWAQHVRSRAIRRGPALRLRHRNGRAMLVSLPQAEEAAAVLGSWRAALSANMPSPTR